MNFFNSSNDNSHSYILEPMEKISIDVEETLVVIAEQCDNLLEQCRFQEKTYHACTHS